MKSAYDSNGFIDWPTILSYDARYTLVIDARTRGKTFGIRLQFIRDYVRRKKRFVELSRVAEFLKGDGKLQQDYFAKYYAEIPDNKLISDHLLTTKGVHAYIAKRPEGEGAKPEWDTLGYFLALTEAEEIKRRSNSFLPVRRFFMDEALIDKSLPGARYHDYLPNEISSVSSIITSVARERPDTPEADRPRLILCGNAVDLTCPWLTTFGITDVPPYGFSWHYGKQCLVWYGPPDEHWTNRQNDSVASGLLRENELLATSNSNEFQTLDAGLFSEVPKGAKVAFGVVYKRQKFGVWIDWADGFYYVDKRLPKSMDGRPIYALTVDDVRPNYIIAKRAQKSLKGFVELYYAGIVKYRDADTRARFLKAMSLFGIR